MMMKEGDDGTIYCFPRDAKGTVEDNRKTLQRTFGPEEL